MQLRRHLKEKLGIPIYTQSNGYYCGPATVKEVVQFHKGSSASQATYAKKLGTTTDGTDMTKIPSVVTTESGRKYVYADIENETTGNFNIDRLGTICDGMHFIQSQTGRWKHGAKADERSRATNGREAEEFSTPRKIFELSAFVRHG